MEQESIAQKIEEMVSRLVERFDPEQIILFGSHARGTAGPGSDVDLMVVLPVSGSKRARRIEMRVALHDIRVPKDIVVVTPKEVARRRDIAGTVIRPALREGKVLYVTTRYPGDYEPIPLAEAQEAVEIARRVRKQVRRFLPQDNPDFRGL